MLAIWRRAWGLEVQRADCMVEAVEGVAVDKLIEQRMRAWYVGLLDKAPARLLPVEDISPSLTVVGLGTMASAWLPAGVRRLLEIRLSGWTNPAVPADIADGSCARRMHLALNPYSAPGPAHPLAALDGPRLYLSPFGHGWSVAAALAVVDPGENTYKLDESLLSTIPQNDL